MRLPIRTEELEFIVATPPKPVPAFGAAPAQRRHEDDDYTIYAFNVLATSGADADVLHVQIVGRLDVAVGEAIRLRMLTAECWEMEGHSGVSFRADGVERVTARGQSAAQPAEDAGS